MEPETRVNPAYRFAPVTPESELVFGASGPGWHAACDHGTALDAWLSFLAEQGIERVCCLLSGDQVATAEGPYVDTFGEDAIRHVPLAPGHLADATRIRTRILPFIDDAVAADEPVLVHGLTGVGRTGQVHAAWLVHDGGYDPETAIETVRKQGRDPLVPVSRDGVVADDVLEWLASFE